MSATISFDTLAYAKKLMVAGFTQQQAEVQAEALVEIIDEKLATKQDIKETEKILRHEMREMEQRIIIRIGAMLVATIAVLVSLLKLL